MEDYSRHPQERLSGLLLNMESRSTLDLSATAFTDQEMHVLSGLNALVTLNLRENPISDDGIAQLDGSPCLTHLDLAFTNVKLPGNEWGIGRFPRLPQLTVLDLSYSLVNNVSIFKQLRNATHNLKSLNLQRVKVGPAWHSEYLSSLPPHISRLDLSGIPVTTYALKTLLSYECLESLALKSCQLDENHLDVLCQFKTLKVLQISENRIRHEQMRELRRLLCDGHRCIVN